MIQVHLELAQPDHSCTRSWASPIEVPIGGILYILSSEIAGGDSWRNAYGNDVQITSTDIGLFSPAWRDASTSNEIQHGGNTTQDEGFTGQAQGFVGFKYTPISPSWTKTGIYYDTDGSHYDIRSAIADASPGDIIRVPAGTFTWGEGGIQLIVDKAVQIIGAGMGQTTIVMHADSPEGFGSHLIKLGDGATIGKMSIIGPNSRSGVFATGDSAGWRITEIEYVQYPGTNPYFLFCQYAPDGLVDNCIINGGAGNAELIFTRGVDDSWDTESTLGSGEKNIFVEGNTFKGEGYVCDANSNSRMVVRNNRIEGKMKVDGHGVWSNGGPQRGVRHMEVYRNLWTSLEERGTAIEMRGGTGMVWGNTADLPTSSNGVWFYLTEYGVFNNNAAFTPNYQTPEDYPIRDQIGRGKYSTPGDFTTASSEPMYLWQNLKGGNVWPFTYKNIPDESLDRYRAQTGNPTATFDWEDVVQADRDYFRQINGFDGSSGVGVGTKVEMLAITPVLTGVGFWVTDEGDWDSLQDGPDGQLYVWDGSAWVLHYTPYTYPHPMRTPNAPTNLTITSP